MAVSSGSASGPPVAFERLAKRYPDGTTAVDDVSAVLAAGSFTALVGASGSGKSTLLQCVNRLVEPTDGRVLIDGRDVRDGPAEAVRRRIGYVFQDTGLFPHLTVAENVAIGWRIAGTHDREETAARVAEMLDLVDLPRTMAARLPEALSGGQRQRIGVARALFTAPGLMLMDEAFGALDPVTRDALGRTMRGLHDRLGLTTILVTHDMAEALLLADRVLVMARGRIVGDASPAALLRGEGGSEAQALVAVPREQAERLARMTREPAA
ncbi:ATP-binding cassette domain-containing protein [uncultured Sphingomonas sp.]|uniref:ATP-binding cassette domain-containing protein n=1 Tax=uncultured Sphingomonas sp. TaxID=158754 RepID=UPI0035C991E4